MVLTFSKRPHSSHGRCPRTQVVVAMTVCCTGFPRNLLASSEQPRNATSMRSHDLVVRASKQPGNDGILCLETRFQWTEHLVQSHTCVLTRARCQGSLTITNKTRSKKLTCRGKGCIKTNTGLAFLVRFFLPWSRCF